MKYVYWGIFWVVVYLVIALAPQFVLLIGPVPAGNGFWWDFSISLGFAGAAMLCMMYFLTARFRRASAPFGIDLVYYFHRYISLVAFFIVIAHPIIMLVLDPGLLTLLVPVTENWPYLTGAGSVIVLILLIAVSLWRKQLSIHYDTWRLWHVILATLALVLTLLHIEGIGNYISSPWKRALWTIILISWLLLLGYVRLLKPCSMLKRPYSVERITREKGDAWTLELRPKGHKGFPFMPGQFAWLTLWDSPFALKEHPFSISSSAKHPDRIGFTIKELGDFTKRMKYVQPDQVAYVDGPYGSFSIDRHPASGYVFIAGGIGIAPILGMLRTLEDRRDKSQLVLFYGYSSLERMTGIDEIKQMKENLRLRIIYILTDPPPDWHGETGFITREVLQRNLPGKKKHYEYFICGPESMIRLMEQYLHELKIPLHHIHSELFDLV